MTLVEHQAPVGRQHGGLFPVVLRLADRQIGREQMMIHHDDIRLGRTAPRPEQEALVEVVALETSAQVGLGAHLVPHLGRGHHGEIAERPVRRVTRPFGDGQQLIVLLGFEQGPLGADRLVEPRETEVVPPALEQGEGGNVVLRRQRPAKERQVLPHQLFLEIDRVGTHDRSFAVGAGPFQRRQQIRERFSHTGTSLEQQDTTVVVSVGDVGGHVALAPPVLVLTQLACHGPVLAERLHHRKGIDSNHGAVAGNLHHDVNLGRGVVDDSETHPGIVQARGHVQVGRGGIEPAPRVIVQQHLPPGRGRRQRQHHVDGSACHGPGGGDYPVAVHLCQKGDLASTRRGNLSREAGANPRREPIGHVFSSFFLAAGKRTLLRMSR